MRQFSRSFGILVTVAVILIILSLNTFAQNPTFTPPPGPFPTPPPFRPSFNGTLCTNQGVENGDFTGYKGYLGRNWPILGLGFNQTAVTMPYQDRFEIKTPGFDPLVNTLPMVRQGDYSIKLGNNSVGREADRLVYTFTVDEYNKRFSACYALVLQNPADHDKDEKPFFQYRINDGSGTPIISERIYADGKAPFIVNGSVVYKNWDCLCLDLSDYLGQTLQIEFIVADCKLSEHFGYAYIDGICQHPSDLVEPNITLLRDGYCLNEFILASRNPVPRETGFSWTIEESDAGGGTPNPASARSKSFTPPWPWPAEIKSLYESLGGTWECNKYYKITLAVSTNCVSGKEISKIIKISCPEINLLPDLCCSKDCGLPLSANPTPTDTTYHWEPAWAFFDPNAPNPQLGLLAPNMYPFTFQVTATDKYGCSLTKSGTVYCGPPALEIKRTDDCCATTTLSVVGQGIAGYSWSTGETSSSITATQPGVYTVTASNPCGSTTRSIDVHTVVTPVTGDFPTRIAFSDIIISGGNGLIINDDSSPLSSTPYNATAYRITIYNELGQLVRIVEKDTSVQGGCRPFQQGDVRWDARTSGGAPIAPGTYFWKLELKNCDRGWTAPSFTRHVNRWVCEKWWPLRFSCRKGHYESEDVQLPERNRVTVWK
jgi:hypothetical protein